MAAANSKESDFYLGFHSLCLRASGSKLLMNRLLFIIHVLCPASFQGKKKQL